MMCNPTDQMLLAVLSPNFSELVTQKIQKHLQLLPKRAKLHEDFSMTPTQTVSLQ
jgi:hypothetical protein